MRKIYPQSCRALLLLILCCDIASAAKKGSYSVPLRRTKRDLRDSRGNPTENLKGRPGQGYFIATDLGTPAQRSIECSVFEPSQTPIVQPVTHVVKLTQNSANQTQSNIWKSNTLAIKHNQRFGNGSFSDCTQNKFHLITNNFKRKINVLVDTGSSNFAVAASPHPYLPFYFHTDKSTSYTDLNRPVAVPYTQGNWEGELGSDLLRFVEGPNATVRVNVASIMSSENFYINGSMWEGILGLGYPRLSKPDSSVLPVFDQFVNDGVVKDSFSMQLCGSSEIEFSSEPTVAGTMVFGEVDEELYEGDLLYTPVVKKWYYEVVITDIAVGGESLNLDCKKYNYDKTIVDSGTTNLRVSEEVFEGILDRLKKFDKLGVPEEFWIGRQMMCWNYDKTPWEEFPDMSISLLSSISNSKEFRLKIPPQLYLRETIERGPLPGQHCYKFAITKADKGTVIGAVIMEGFYVVFDRENVQVGFAATTCGAEGRLNPSSEVSGPFSRDAVDCEYIETESSDTALLTVAYVMAGVCGLCLLPIFVLLVQASCKRRKQQQQQQQQATSATDQPSDRTNLRNDFYNNY